VPTYEYRCPDGHLFEVFKSINAPAPEVCAVCGKSPVTVVLHPVAVHFKGSGFYTTDYGRGGKRKDSASKDGSGPSESKSSESKSSESSGGSGESGTSDKTKAAEA
jgi:putative FmdB family regulatory protein